jgi:hypothetical protein
LEGRNVGRKVGKKEIKLEGRKASWEEGRKEGRQVKRKEGRIQYCGGGGSGDGEVAVKKQ